MHKRGRLQCMPWSLHDHFRAGDSSQFGVQGLHQLLRVLLFLSSEGTRDTPAIGSGRPHIAQGMDPAETVVNPPFIHCGYKTVILRLEEGLLIRAEGYRQ